MHILGLSCFYHDSAACLLRDGEILAAARETTSFGIGEDNNLEILYTLRFPHSLGLLYSGFTYYRAFSFGQETTKAN